MLSWIGSYLAANFALVTVTGLAVAALGAIAFFARNWKAAVAAAAVLGAGFAYQQIEKSAYQRRVAEEAAAQVDQLKQRLNVLNAASEQDARRAAADQARISDLEEQARAKPAATDQSRHVCFDRTATRRVSAIRWAEPGGSRAADGAGRHPKLFSRRR